MQHVLTVWLLLKQKLSRTDIKQLCFCPFFNAKHSCVLHSVSFPVFSMFLICFKTASELT